MEVGERLGVQPIEKGNVAEQRALVRLQPVTDAVDLTANLLVALQDLGDRLARAENPAEEAALPARIKLTDVEAAERRQHFA